MLFEMLRDGPVGVGWASNEVEEALDLCLGCKGCKSDCPVNVDIATYKAEFRAHHYQGRLRPRAAYSMGLIHEWSRLAGNAPALANALLRAPGVQSIAKWVGGIAPQRTIPAYARETFVHWFRRREGSARGERVLLWPDTFNNFFRPQTAIAATHLLEHFGFTVVIPDRTLCCGRPLYDWGMLDRAKALWEKTLSTLAAEIANGTTIVGLEPACVSAFRDELPGLFPRDERAQKLAKQTLFLTEFIAERCGVQPGARRFASALVQMHCHHHAVIKPASEQHVLDQLGIDYEIMKSGCCGMAGSFGFESGKYDVSMAAAERMLFPRIRMAEPDTLIIANGFSCREQIEQGTGRPTQHVAEVLSRALLK
jgi:Fe-S oxidoreductase